MVKHTQTIRRQIADDFVGLALKGLTCEVISLYGLCDTYLQPFLLS